MARPGLTRHRKFLRLSRAIGGPIIARGALELLWDSCYECGDDYVGTASDVELLIGWTGEPGVLAMAMVEAGAPEGQGFIEPVPGGGPSTRYRVHDLWHHAPDYVAKRHKRELERNQKVKPCIADRRTAPDGGHWPPSLDCPNEVDRTPAPAPALAPAPAPAQKSVSSEPPYGDLEPVDDPPAAFFQVVGKGGPEWLLRQSQVDSWQALYLNLDVDAEMRKAVAWVAANIGRRKTAKGMPAFLVNWLNRATDSRGGSSTKQREYNADEVRRFNDWLRAVHGCGHEPRCEDRRECMSLFVGRLRGAA